MILKLTPSQMHNVSGEGFVFFTVTILRTCLSTLLFLVLLKKGKNTRLILRHYTIMDICDQIRAVPFLACTTTTMCSSLYCDYAQYTNLHKEK